MTLPIPSSEITPEPIYRSRRSFMLGLGGLALAACGAPARPTVGQPSPTSSGGGATPAAPVLDDTPGSTQATADERGDVLTSHKWVINYNNFYEFSTDKEEVARLARDFRTTPWTLTVGGLVNKPATFGVEDLITRFGQEERVYRMRCVEGWSMVIPWLGFSLGKLLEAVEPQGSAAYVRFEGLHDSEQMPGQRFSFFEWPYIEGLRLDEARHPLTILSTGLYGKSLLPQNGAPLRLVVPWKYGFKSIKSIVKLDLVAEQPRSLWMTSAPQEYGFFANVNPAVAHPRWSQSSERRIGETNRRPTLPFNGYAEQVEGLYAGLDLRKNY